MTWPTVGACHKHSQVKPRIQTRSPTSRSLKLLKELSVALKRSAGGSNLPLPPPISSIKRNKSQRLCSAAVAPSPLLSVIPALVTLSSFASEGVTHSGGGSVLTSASERCHGAATPILPHLPIAVGSARLRPQARLKKPSVSAAFLPISLLTAFKAHQGSWVRDSLSPDVSGRCQPESVTLHICLNTSATLRFQDSNNPHRC